MAKSRTEERIEAQRDVTLTALRGLQGWAEANQIPEDMQQGAVLAVVEAFRLHRKVLTGTATPRELTLARLQPSKPVALGFAEVLGEVEP
jgi:hypothetical protein